jgi:hypothetical protein
MTWSIRPGHRNWTATLVVAVGAALVASVSVAPLVGALPSSNKSSWAVEPSWRWGSRTASTRRTDI